MLKIFGSKRWRLGIIGAVLSSVMLVFATGGSSYAVPGESSKWLEDNIDGGVQPLYTAGYVSEARNAGNLMQIWRSNDAAGNIWIDVNDGAAVQLPGTTRFNPVVVPYGSSGYAAFHTGTDSQIYMATFGTPGVNSIPWSGWRGTGYYSAFEPSATQLGSGSNQLFLVYRSTGTTAVLGAYYNGNNWGSGQVLGGSTFSAPTVTFNPVNDRIWAAHTGLDNRVYIQWQQLGSSTWNGWYSVGGEVAGPVGFASTINGNMQLAARDPYGYVWFQEVNVAGTATGWTQDVAHWQSRWPVFLSAAGAVLYAILTGYNDNRVWYKQSFVG